MTRNLQIHPSSLSIWGGIECTINRVGDHYFDQLEYGGLYENDFIEKALELPIEKIRFPILWERHQPERDKEIDWTWTDKQLALLQSKEIEPIAGLVHHGSGPAFTNLLDPQFPYLLADYARKVALRYPHIKYYTPVNEPLTTARFSGLYGLWYPHHKNDHSFLIMLLHQLKGVVLAMQEIRKINPQAQLIQTEDLGKTYSTPKLAYQAHFENERRWLTYDLLSGKVNEQHKLWKYFTIKNNIPVEQLSFFSEHVCTPEVFGFNHYVTSERYLDEALHKYPAHTYGSNKRHRYADVEAVRVKIDEQTGIKNLLSEAWQRYHQPMAVTEVHLHCHREEQLRWFRHILENCVELKNDGVQIEAVTAWALFGSHGWDKLLTIPKGNYEPGVFDTRGGQPRPTALATFIKNKSGTNKIENFHLPSKGWWQRDFRLLYPRDPAPHQWFINNAHIHVPVLILGKNGTLGKAFAKLCTERALPYKLLNREECDITQPQSIQHALARYKPWAVINAAGYVKVDEAEREMQQCFDVNEHGSIHLAAACVQLGIKLLTFSTDLVFDGKKADPYLESDETNPLNVYGASKAFAEKAIKETDPDALIIRTSAFFSPWDRYNFLHWVEQTLTNENMAPVAKDIFISPTYVPHLVHAALDLLIDDESGIWHLANKGSISWADLAFVTAERSHLNKKFIRPLYISEMNLPAERPLYSVLGSEKGFHLPSLDFALQCYFNEKNPTLIERPVPELV